MRLKGIIYTILSGLLYGFAPVICGLTYAYGNNATSTAFFRGLFVLPILAVLMIKNKISFKITWNEFIKILIVSLFGQVITTILLYGSIEYVGAGTSTTLHFLYPLVVTLICHYVYRDKLTKTHIIALSIALLGIAMFLDLNDLTKLTGVIMAVASSVTFAIYLVGVEKLHLSRINDLKLTFYISLCMCACTYIYGSFTNTLVLNQPIQSYIYLILIAILAQLCAVTFLKKGIEILGSSMASLLSMFEPVTSVIFGVLLLNEELTVLKVIGCVLILFSISLLIKKDE